MGRCKEQLPAVGKSLHVCEPPKAAPDGDMRAHTVVDQLPGLFGEMQGFQLVDIRIGCSARECVFVDNSAANLRAAQRLGIRTVHFNRDGEPYEGCQVEDFQELAEMLETGIE